MRLQLTLGNQGDFSFIYRKRQDTHFMKRFR